MELNEREPHAFFDNASTWLLVASKCAHMCTDIRGKGGRGCDTQRRTSTAANEAQAAQCAELNVQHEAQLRELTTDMELRIELATSTTAGLHNQLRQKDEQIAEQGGTIDRLQGDLEQVQQQREALRRHIAQGYQLANSPELTVDALRAYQVPGMIDSMMSGMDVMDSKLTDVATKVEAVDKKLGSDDTPPRPATSPRGGNAVSRSRERRARATTPTMGCFGGGGGRSKR